jgi:hypothetical protein
MLKIFKSMRSILEVLLYDLAAVRGSRRDDTIESIRTCKNTLHIVKNVSNRYIIANLAEAHSSKVVKVIHLVLFCKRILRLVEIESPY